MAFLPISVMIAGVQKGGTTSLAALLERHPRVVSHPEVEFPYFVSDRHYQYGYEENIRRQFPVVPQGGQTVLAKSAGLCFHPFAVQRLKRHNPETVIVVVLREPASRAHSAYWYLRRTGQEPMTSFSAAVAAEQSRLESDFSTWHHAAYRARGEYAVQVERLFEAFGRDQVHVAFSEELFRSGAEAALPIWRLLGLTPADDGPLPLVNAARGARSELLASALRRPSPLMRVAAGLLPGAARRGLKQAVLRANERGLSVPPAERDVVMELRHHFIPHNSALADLLGRDLPWPNPERHPEVSP